MKIHYQIKQINFIAVLLSFCLIISLLSACNDTKGQSSSSGTSSQNNSSIDSSSDGSSSSSDVSSGEDNSSSEDPYTGENGDSSSDSDTDIVEPLFVHNSEAPLSTRFLGGGTSVYLAYTYMKDSGGRNYTDEMAQLEFNRIQNMGIKRVRTIFKFAWAWDKNTNNWNWDSDNMKAFYRWVGEMQKRGIDVMVNPWSFEYLVNGTSSISDTPYLYVENDFAETCNRFSDATAELFRQLKARGLSNAKYLVLFTEPCPPYNSSIDPVGGDNRDKYVQIAKAVHNKLTLAGIRKSIQIMGPNQSNDNNTALLDDCIAKADECFDIYSTHSYIKGVNIASDAYSDNATLLWSPKVDAMRMSGSKKSFWIDEYNVQDYAWTQKGYSNVGFDEPWRGTQQAVVFATGMNLGIDNMSLWSLADQQWPNQNNTDKASGFYDGEMDHGIFRSMNVSLIPKAQYYSYSLISKYFGNGGKTYYSASENDYVGLYISACNTNQGDWTFMVVSTNYEPSKVTVNLQKALPGVKLYRHLYSPGAVNPTTKAQIIGADKTYLKVTKSFSDTLPVGAVAIYTTIKG